MLVITRKTHEAVFIGQNIKVVIVQVQGDKVRLGIDCDKKIPILREELCETVWGFIPIIGEGRDE